MVIGVNERLCWNCYNLEDRRDIDGNLLCAKGHAPRKKCEDHLIKGTDLREVKMSREFCWSCQNFENRKDVEGVILCARGHIQKEGCEDFVDIRKKLREISDKNRYMRVMIKVALIERKTLTSYFSL